MSRLIAFVVALAMVGAGVYLLTQEPPPPDYAVMAQPALASATSAQTEDEKFTAIVEAREAFVAIVREIDTEDEVALALPHLTRLAENAERLDDELRADEDAYDALLERREAEAQASAMSLGNLMIATAFKPKLMTEILDPLEQITGTLGP